MRADTLARSAPADARSRPGGGWRLVPVALAGIVAIGILAASNLGSSLVYYKTPTEVVRGGPHPTQRIRLGGLVQEGSVRRTLSGVAFLLTDGVTTVPVQNTGTPSGVFAAGRGAVVEGTWNGRTFASDSIVVKHSNEYRSGTDRPYQVPTSTGTGR